MSKGIDIKKLKKRTGPEKGDNGSFSISNLLNKEITLFNNDFTAAWREQFYAELFVMMRSGLDMRTALELLGQSQPKKPQCELVGKILTNIINGSSLSEAMTQSGKFGPYEYYSILIGEETGKLPLVMKDLAKFYGGQVKHRRQLVQAFSYPLMVMATAFFAVFFMLNYVVPMFSDVFSTVGGDLPWLTQQVLSVSAFFKGNIIYVAVGMAVIGAVLYSLRNNGRLREAGSRLILRVPILGDLVRSIYLSRFTQVMGLLIASKVPMLRAVSMVEKMIGFYPLELDMQKAQHDIMNGVQLNESLKGSEVFSNKLISLIKVGEEVNQLETIFESLSEQLSNDIEYKTGVLSSFLEPLLIVFLASIVGVILVAMYLPMFQLSVGLSG